MKKYLVTITNIETEANAVAIAHMISDDIGYDAEVCEDLANS